MWHFIKINVSNIYQEKTILLYFVSNFADEMTKAYKNKNVLIIILKIKIRNKKEGIILLTLLGILLFVFQNNKTEERFLL